MSICINKMEATIKELRGSSFKDALEIDRLKKELEEKALDRLLLEKCLDSAYETYRSNWDSSCEKLRKPKGCSLPHDIVERWDKIYKELREDCFKKYPQD